MSVRADPAFWDGRRVLVTGGYGFTGRHLCRRLSELGAGPIGVVDLPDVVGSTGESLPFAEPLAGDLRDRSAADVVVRWAPQVVIHLAALAAGIGFSVAHQVRMTSWNLAVDANMLDAVAEAGCERVLLISSSCVYPDDAPLPNTEDWGFRGFPESGNEGYGWAKRILEQNGRLLQAETGCQVGIVRPSNLYGPGAERGAERNHVIPALAQRILDAGDSFEVWGSGEQTRSFIHVRDAVEGMLVVLERHAEGDAVNLARAEETSVRDLVGVLLEVIGSSAAPRYDPTKPVGKQRKCQSVERLEAVTGGFRAETPLREGLADVIEELRATAPERPGRASSEKG